jgi:hypothetical protein
MHRCELCNFLRFSASERSSLHNFAEADFAPYLMTEALGQRMASNKDIEGWVKRFLMTYISIDASCFPAAISVQTLHMPPVKGMPR